MTTASVAQYDTRYRPAKLVFVAGVDLLMTDIEAAESDSKAVLDKLLERSKVCPKVSRRKACIIDRLRKTTYAEDGSEVYTPSATDFCGVKAADLECASSDSEIPKGDTCSPLLKERPAMEPMETFCGRYLL